jgi:16S rRNA (adenine1518-N6/adenine1519-N6)-dimethyltransferase
VSGSQVTLARMREFGIRPDRDLGQHFLVDDNVLEVAGRLLPLGPDDVVLEVGAGLGVLTAWLARRVAIVHAVEVDRRLEPALAATLADAENVRVVWADAARIDPAELDPRPSALVANLPYNVATPVIVRALPAVERFCVMVQREIADRLFARPGTKAYGAVSVLVQLAAERTGFHPVARTVFRPRPNVDSALVAFRRRGELPPDYPRVKTVVGAAFTHRRKTLPNSLELAGLAPRAEAAAALEAISRGSSTRAEELRPEDFVALAEALP